MSTVRGLDRPETGALVARRHVGRVTCGGHDDVHIEPPGQTPQDQDTYGRTLAGLRELVPEPFGADAPAPHGPVLLCVYGDRMTGRVAAAVAA